MCECLVVVVCYSILEPALLAVRWTLIRALLRRWFESVAVLCSAAVVLVLVSVMCTVRCVSMLLSDSKAVLQCLAVVILMLAVVKWSLCVFLLVMCRRESVVFLSMVVATMTPLMRVGLLPVMRRLMSERSVLVLTLTLMWVH